MYTVTPNKGKEIKHLEVQRVLVIWHQLPYCICLTYAILSFPRQLYLQRSNRTCQSSMIIRKNQRNKILTFVLTFSFQSIFGICRLECQVGRTTSGRSGIPKCFQKLCALYYLYLVIIERNCKRKAHKKGRNLHIFDSTASRFDILTVRLPTTA